MQRVAEERRAGHRAAWSAFWINLVLMLGKGLAGLLFGSQALVADAAHSLGDAAGSFAVVFGVRAAERPPDPRHRYGHAKAEPLAGLAVGAILAAVGLLIGADALGTLVGPGGALWGRAGGGGVAGGLPGTGMPGLPALYAAIVALVAKEGLYRWNMRLGRRLNSPALLANAADHRADEWTSAAAIVGIVGARMGFPLADPLAALVVAGLVILYAGQVVAANVDSLLDLEADKATRDLVRDAALSVEGVREVQRFRTRRSGPFVHVDMEIGVDGTLSLVEADRLAHRVMDAIERLDVVQDVVVHVNPV